MKHVFTSNNLPDALMIKSLLEQEGIAAMVKNEVLHSAHGQMGGITVWPEVWILQDDQLEKATTIVNDWNKAISNENHE